MILSSLTKWPKDKLDSLTMDKVAFFNPEALKWFQWIDKVITDYYSQAFGNNNIDLWSINIFDSIEDLVSAVKNWDINNIVLPSQDSLETVWYKRLQSQLWDSIEWLWIHTPQSPTDQAWFFVKDWKLKFWSYDKAYIKEKNEQLAGLNIINIAEENLKNEIDVANEIMKIKYWTQDEDIKKIVEELWLWEQYSIKDIENRLSLISKVSSSVKEWYFDIDALRYDLLNNKQKLNELFDSKLKQLEEENGFTADKKILEELSDEDKTELYINASFWKKWENPVQWELDFLSRLWVIPKWKKIDNFTEVAHNALIEISKEYGLPLKPSYVREFKNISEWKNISRWLVEWFAKKNNIPKEDVQGIFERYYDEALVNYKEPVQKKYIGSIVDLKSEKHPKWSESSKELQPLLTTYPDILKNIVNPETLQTIIQSEMAAWNLILNTDGSIKEVYTEVGGEKKPSQLFAKMIADWFSEQQALKTWLQVRTPEFKNRFGDRTSTDKSQVSKIVDENGEPLVVYHGTTRDFESFSNEYIWSWGGANQWYWLNFTNNIDVARQYTKERKIWPDWDWISIESDKWRVIESYVLLKNPIIIEKRSMSKIWDYFSKEKFKDVIKQWDISKWRRFMENNAYNRLFWTLEPVKLKEKIANMSDDDLIDMYYDNFKWQYMEGSVNWVAIIQWALRKFYSTDAIWNKTFLKNFEKSFWYDWVIDKSVLYKQWTVWWWTDKVVVSFNENNIKTESQLRKIREEANKNVDIEQLIQEAKSADEFINKLEDEWKIYYHGSRNKIDTILDTVKSKYAGDRNVLFLSSRKDTSTLFWPVVSKVYVSPKKPLIIDAKNKNYFEIPTPKIMKDMWFTSIESIDTDLAVEFVQKYDLDYDSVLFKNIIEWTWEHDPDDAWTVIALLDKNIASTESQLHKIREEANKKWLKKAK